MSSDIACLNDHKERMGDGGYEWPKPMMSFPTKQYHKTNLPTFNTGRQGLERSRNINHYPKHGLIAFLKRLSLHLFSKAKLQK